jgi:hypothetical protein
MLKNDKFAVEGNKSKVVRRTVLTYKSGPHLKSLRNAVLGHNIPKRGRRTTNDKQMISRETLHRAALTELPPPKSNPTQ